VAACLWLVLKTGFQYLVGHSGPI